MSSDSEREDRARAFEHGAHAYRAARPTYPDEAVRWAVPEHARDVLDLGAGTGKLTQRLVALGLHVTAVEPSRAMREELQSSLPGIEARAGSAEHTGLPADSFDAVTVAQAWHWFEPVAASTEIARVLRPGGSLAVLWNVRDSTVDWVARFTEIIHRGDTLETSYGEPDLGPEFGPIERIQVPWVDHVSTSSLRTLAASRSHLIVLPDEAREKILEAVDELVRTHPDLRGRDEVEMPYLTACWRATTLR